MPSPKWKLVVDISKDLPSVTPSAHFSTSSNSPSGAGGLSKEQNQHGKGTIRDHAHLHSAVISRDKYSEIDQLISLLGECMPSDPSLSPASHATDFVSLRLLLLRPQKSPKEEDIVRTVLGSFTSYCSAGRSREDIAMMLAHEYLLLSQQLPTPQQHQYHCHPDHIRRQNASSGAMQQNTRPPGFDSYTRCWTHPTTTYYTPSSTGSPT